MDELLFRLFIHCPSSFNFKTISFVFVLIFESFAGDVSIYAPFAEAKTVL